MVRGYDRRVKVCVMRKLIILGLMAATSLPAAAPAAAQSRAEIQRDRRDVREEQRDLRQAQRHGDRRDIREERGDVREARRELREDRQDRRDWRQYRQGNRQLYARGNFRSPFAYRTFRPGLAIGNGYYGSRYVIADPYRYRLPAARPGLRWVRHYDDVLLVDVRRGRVVEVIRNFFW
jgi:Ni/Co efflux regulator RcnB